MVKSIVNMHQHSQKNEELEALLEETHSKQKKNLQNSKMSLNQLWANCAVKMIQIEEQWVVHYWSQHWKSFNDFQFLA